MLVPNFWRTEHQSRLGSTRRQCLACSAYNASGCHGTTKTRQIKEKSWEDLCQLTMSVENALDRDKWRRRIYVAELRIQPKEETRLIYPPCIWSAHKTLLLFAIKHFVIALTHFKTEKEQPKRFTAVLAFSINDVSGKCT